MRTAGAAWATLGSRDNAATTRMTALEGTWMTWVLIWSRRRKALAPSPLKDAMAPSRVAVLAEDLKVTRTGIRSPLGMTVGVSVGVSVAVGVTAGVGLA